MRDTSPIILASRLVAGEPPDAECLAWLRAGFARFLRGAGPAGVCLRLTGASRIAARNAALARAANLIDCGRGISAWALAEELRQAVVRFQSVTLPRIQRGDAGELTPVQSALADAFSSGALPLTSRRRLYGLLTS
jgi:hypothetical protein